MVGQRKIGVLMGGLSAERDISIRSGESILAALTDRGYDLLVEAAPLHVHGVRDYLVDLSSREDIAALGRVMNAVTDRLIECHPEADLRP